MYFSGDGIKITITKQICTYLLVDRSIELKDLSSLTWEDTADCCTRRTNRCHLVSHLDTGRHRLRRPCLGSDRSPETSRTLNKIDTQTDWLNWPLKIAQTREQR